MTKDDAVKTFGLGNSFDQDDVQDAYEESFFSTRDYFLKNTVIPQLFISRLQRLKKFEEAFCTLTGQTVEWEDPTLNAQPEIESAIQNLGLEAKSLEELLKAYEAKLTEKRMFLAQSWTIPDVVKSTLQVVEVQQAYHVLFEELGSAEVSSSHLDMDDVKASQQIDSGLILKQLKERESSEEAEHEFQKSVGQELTRVKKLNRLLKTSAGNK